MAVITAMVPRDVERAQQPSCGVDDRRGSAGQKRIALQEVLAAMHHHRRTLSQRGADRIGAAPLLVPVGAWPQGDALRAIQETRVPQRLQQRALGIGQDHHAIGIVGLLEQELHHRPGMRDQFALMVQRLGELRGRRMRRAWRPACGRQPELQTALPALAQCRVDQIGRHLAAVQQLASRRAQARGQRTVGRWTGAHRSLRIDPGSGLWYGIADRQRINARSGRNRFDVNGPMNCPVS